MKAAAVVLSMVGVMAVMVAFIVVGTWLRALVGLAGLGVWVP